MADNDLPDAVPPSFRGPKPNPHRQIQLAVLRGLTADEKLRQVFMLGERANALMKHGLRIRHPELSDEELHALYLSVRARCYNQNY